jgi:hypothetical protein
MNSQPNSHTHCQASQAKAQTKAWQRVYLPARTTDRLVDERKKQRRHTAPTRKWRFSA